MSKSTAPRVHEHGQWRGSGGEGVEARVHKRGCAEVAVGWPKRTRDKSDNVMPSCHPTLGIASLEGSRRSRQKGKDE